MANKNTEAPSKGVYYGKCQYKTGKCYNERTFKRNGEVHTLCEEHRTKQNSIQRRSDRKYQTVHAVRRRERSQRRAVLKRQASMAVAQQLFFEHQHQKTMGIPLPSYHPLHLLTVNPNDGQNMSPIRIPPPIGTFNDQNEMGSPLVLSILPQNNCITYANNKSGHAPIKDESTPTGIDDLTPSAFLTIPMYGGDLCMPTLRDDEILVSSTSSDSFGYMPITLSSGEKKESWSEDDIEFLQTILL